MPLGTGTHCQLPTRPPPPPYQELRMQRREWQFKSSSARSRGSISPLRAMRLFSRGCEEHPVQPIHPVSRRRQPRPGDRLPETSLPTQQ